MYKFLYYTIQQIFKQIIIVTASNVPCAGGFKSGDIKNILVWKAQKAGHLIIAC